MSGKHAALATRAAFCCNHRCLQATSRPRTQTIKEQIRRPRTLAPLPIYQRDTKASKISSKIKQRCTKHSAHGVNLTIYSKKKLEPSIKNKKNNCNHANCFLETSIDFPLYNKSLENIALQRKYCAKL